jgi:guanylate kinase
MKIILVGKSASGKDYILNLCSDIITPCVKTTTRPQRDDEVDGKSYYFINNKNFENMIKAKHFLVWEKFIIKNKVWYYGISKKEYNKKDICIMTPKEIKQLDDTILNGVKICYIKSSVFTRYARLKKRKDKNDSIFRRMFTDFISFLFFRKYDIILKNNI